MNETKMKMWLYLLENTNLPQGEGELGNPDTGLCCMGVAHHALFIDKHLDYSGYLSTEHNTELGLNRVVLESELERMGLYDGDIEGGERKHVLSHLNDIRDFSFPEIATVIREMGWDKDAE